MKSILPITGSSALLTELSAHIPDEFINQLVLPPKGRGRRWELTPAQVWRIHLLSLLTPVHSFNLLLRLLVEQRAWRQFAGLSNRQQVPGVRMLHEFRNRIGVHGLRCINEHLLKPLLCDGMDGSMSVALMDATDLPASSSGHKKRVRDDGRQRERPWAHAL